MLSTSVMREEELEREKGKLSLKWQDETRAGAVLEPPGGGPQCAGHPSPVLIRVWLRRLGGSGGKLQGAPGLDSPRWHIIPTPGPEGRPSGRTAPLATAEHWEPTPSSAMRTR